MNTYEIMQLIEHTSENNVLEIYKVSSEQSAVYNANGSFLGNNKMASCD